MKSLTADQINLLKSPLPPQAIKPHPTKTYLSSIKAIYVVERLNEVFGLGGWFCNNEVVKEHEKWVVVKTTFQAPEYGIVIPDIFGGNDNSDLGDAYKGACTDALTKIGSYLYIGMDVYKGLGETNGTTSYNHKKLDSPGKKLISNAQLKQLLERVRGGDVQSYTKAIETFSFEEAQKYILDEALKSLKIKA